MAGTIQVNSFDDIDMDSKVGEQAEAISYRRVSEMNPLPNPLDFLMADFESHPAEAAPEDEKHDFKLPADLTAEELMVLDPLLFSNGKNRADVACVADVAMKDVTDQEQQQQDESIETFFERLHEEAAANAGYSATNLQLTSLDLDGDLTLSSAPDEKAQEVKAADSQAGGATGEQGEQTSDAYDHLRLPEAVFPDNSVAGTGFVSPFDGMPSGSGPDRSFEHLGFPDLLGHGPYPGEYNSAVRLSTPLMQPISGSALINTYPRAIHRLYAPFGQLQSPMSATKPLMGYRPFPSGKYGMALNRSYPAAAQVPRQNSSKRAFAIPTPFVRSWLDQIDTYAPPMQRKRPMKYSRPASLFSEGFEEPETDAAGTRNMGDQRPSDLHDSRTVEPAGCAAESYSQPASSPPPWGSCGQFTYIPTGELLPNARFSVEDIREFIYGGADGYRPRRLVLRVGRTPQKCNERYSCHESMKCRFDACLDPRGSMEKGVYRVVLDEWDDASHEHNPFHHPVVHLWCLERFLDFPEICSLFDVRMEMRQRFGKGDVQDRQAIGMKLAEEAEIQTGQDFIEYCCEYQQPPPFERGYAAEFSHGGRFSRYPHFTERGTGDDLEANSEDPQHGPYVGTLSHRMAAKKLKGTPVFQRHQETRPKASKAVESRFIEHRFDLPKMVEGRRRTRRASGQIARKKGARRRMSSVQHDVDINPEIVRYWQRRNAVDGEYEAFSGVDRGRRRRRRAETIDLTIDEEPHLDAEHGSDSQDAGLAHALQGYG